jgi:hypothetical protein
LSKQAAKKIVCWIAGIRLCFFRFAGGTPAIRWSVIQFKNDPQITQIKKIILNLKAKSLIPNSEFRIKKKARLPTR